MVRTAAAGRMESSHSDVVDALIEEWRAERPDFDTDAMSVVGRIFLISHKLHQRVSVTLKDFNLNYSDFDLLATLRRSGEPYEMTPTDLMQSVLITSGAMTALLDRLTARGLIERGQDRRDRRVRTAILTKKGNALVEKAARARFAEASAATACFSARERVVLAQSLKVMNGWLDETGDVDWS